LVEGLIHDFFGGLASLIPFGGDASYFAQNPSGFAPHHFSLPL
jgi:hypothetical protein